VVESLVEGADAVDEGAEEEGQRAAGLRKKVGAAAPEKAHAARGCIRIIV
jgi:hypothetical protein